MKKEKAELLKKLNYLSLAITQTAAYMTNVTVLTQGLGQHTSRSGGSSSVSLSRSYDSSSVSLS